MKNKIEFVLGKKVKEIQDTADFRGVSVPVPELIGDEYYIEIPSIGVSMVLPDGETVTAIHLHAENHEGYSQYQGEIPTGILFSMSREQVRKILGAPIQYSDGRKVLLLGERPAWDAYIINDLKIHFEYAENTDSIGLVTLSTMSI
jgi:hypothetical protein